MRLAAGVVLAVTLAGCASSSSNGAHQDQVFLRMTAYSDALSVADVGTRIELGHAMCDHLKQHHGDVAAADADMARGYEKTFTPSLLADLRFDATAAYCPRYH